VIGVSEPGRSGNVKVWEWESRELKDTFASQSIAASLALSAISGRRAGLVTVAEDWRWGRFAAQYGNICVGRLHRRSSSWYSHIMVVTLDLAPELENRGFSEGDWNRYRQLIEKRRAEQLNAEELVELTSLSDRMERLNVRRLELLSQLAKLRNTTLPALMDQLGLHPVPVSGRPTS
jgi:hypothetical protein